MSVRWSDGMNVNSLGIFFPRPMSTDIFCSRWNIVVIETSVWQMSYWWDELLNGNSTLSTSSSTAAAASLSLCSHQRKQSSNSTELHLCLRKRHTSGHVCTDALFILMSTRVGLSIWRVEILVSKFVHRVRREKEKETARGIILLLLHSCVPSFSEHFFSSYANATHNSRRRRSRRKENRVSPFCLHYYVSSSVLRLRNVNNIFNVGRNDVIGLRWTIIIKQSRQTIVMPTRKKKEVCFFSLQTESESVCSIFNEQTTTTTAGERNRFTPVRSSELND